MEEIERSLQLMWQVVIPKLGQNVIPNVSSFIIVVCLGFRTRNFIKFTFIVHLLPALQISQVVAARQSAAIITAMVSAWSFVLTTMDGLKLNSKDWQELVNFCYAASSFAIDLFIIIIFARNLNLLILV